MSSVDLILSGPGVRILHRLLANRGAKPVDAEPAGQGREPGPERIVVPQRVQTLVGAGEGVLEHVVGVGFGEPEGLGDRVDVAGVALDELPPGVRIAGSAACDELGIGVHRRIKPAGAGKEPPWASRPTSCSGSGDSDWVEKLGPDRARREGGFVRPRRRPGGARGARGRRRGDRPRGGAPAALQGVVRRDHPRRARARVRRATPRGGSRRRSSTATTRATTSRAGRSGAPRSRRGCSTRGSSMLAFSFVAGPRGESRDEPEQTARVFDLPARPLARARVRLGSDRLRPRKRLPLDHRQVPQAPEDWVRWRGRTWGRS